MKKLGTREWLLLTLDTGTQGNFKIYLQVLVTRFMCPGVLESRHKSQGFRDPDLDLHILAKLFITYYFVF